MSAAEAFIARSRYYLATEYPAKLCQALRVLPADRLWWRPNEHSNSAGNLVLHLCGNVRQWVVSGIGGAADARQRDSEFSAREGHSAADLEDLLLTTLAEVDVVLARLTPADLLDSRSIQGRSTSVLAALYHVVEHFSTHVGQVLWIAKMFTPAGEVRFYDDARGAAPRFLEPGRSDI